MKIKQKGKKMGKILYNDYSLLMESIKNCLKLKVVMMASHGKLSASMSTSKSLVLLKQLYYILLISMVGTCGSILHHTSL